MTISILGCGWYGMALAKSLIAKGVAVNGSTTSPGKLAMLKAEGIMPFIIDLSADNTGFSPEFFNCDVLIIAIPPKSRSGEGGEYVPKLKRVIDAIHHYAVKKVILISSTGVYSEQNTELDEFADPMPNTPSGKILYDAEELFRNQTGLKTTIIRFGGLVGPGRDPGRFFAGKKDIPNGLAPVNMIHQDDCVGLTLAVINKDAFGYTLNACTPHHPPKFAFYTQAAARYGLEQPEFLAELKEWKIISGVTTSKVLGYDFRIKNWFDWLA
ncbi:SDR family oxidoreductase [Mucilaginibacter sp. 14171R-50]|uniref:SDR family oxidoreductase n=1 Tax=Mucilaginibacter sp. 14171R-50 TaxID=2703789 RepID=UPI00138CCFD1|nr:SDR family oxidoreductase [Mucilaginibacter sp. 14171R-50]QHS57569.1 SDR family oxidoreductase [Mucilaginibacter sp. 14171R-50]